MSYASTSYSRALCQQHMGVALQHTAAGCEETCSWYTQLLVPQHALLKDAAAVAGTTGSVTAVPRALLLTTLPALLPPALPPPPLLLLLLLRRRCAVYSSSWLRRRASLLVRLMFSSLARSTISLRLRADTS